MQSVHGGPWHPTFVPWRRLEILRFFIEIITLRLESPSTDLSRKIEGDSARRVRNHMLGTQDFTGSEHWAPFRFS